MWNRRMKLIRVSSTIRAGPTSRSLMYWRTCGLD
uniref:(California timema) hypothetical protein n=1 Tax=Timema californicum TaxID=61474 RepID=A0A7R9JL78_TIMCA|nr:unnamed protein product [Timema californicum]